MTVPDVTPQNAAISRDPTTAEIAETLMSYSECLEWAERFKATPFNMLSLATVAAKAASPLLVMKSLFALAARVQELEADRENLGCAHPQSAERDGAVNAKDNPPATDDGASSDLTDRQPELPPRSSTAAEAAAWRGSWWHQDGTVRHA